MNSSRALFFVRVRLLLALIVLLLSLAWIELEFEPALSPAAQLGLFGAVLTLCAGAALAVHSLSRIPLTGLCALASWSMLGASTFAALWALATGPASPQAWHGLTVAAFVLATAVAILWCSRATDKGHR